MALSHSRDARLAPGGKCVLFFDSAKQESELDQLRKEERLVKVAGPSLVSSLFFAFLCVLGEIGHLQELCVILCSCCLS